MLIAHSSSVKRPRGRPRKQPPRQDTLAELGTETQRITRHARQQFKQDKILPQKRRAEDDLHPAGQGFRPSAAMKAAKAAQNRQPTEPQIFRSPRSSHDQSPPTEQNRVKDKASTSPAKEAAVLPRRRVIEQFDDDSEVMDIYQQEKLPVSR